MNIDETGVKLLRVIAESYGKGRHVVWDSIDRDELTHEEIAQVRYSKVLSHVFNFSWFGGRGHPERNLTSAMREFKQVYSPRKAVPKNRGPVPRNKHPRVS